ncbi:MAG: DUF262 domain-containing protein [Euzebya sp.]
MAQHQEVTLAGVFNERFLHVPDYQRPYAWGPKQLDDLWEDLDLLGPTGRHYAGTLVLKPQRDGSGEPVISVEELGDVLHHMDVVDGQQRLTTCLILLDRLRRALASLGDDQEVALQMAVKIRRTYGVLTINSAERPRLILGADFHSLWRDSILGDQPVTVPQLTGGQQRLLAARDFFDSRLKDLTTDIASCTALERLKDLHQRVTNGLRFLVYEVSTAADVGVIFETLNERGRPLSDLEKTKNYLLYLARQIRDDRGEQLAQEINERWTKIFSHLANAQQGEEDQLLRWHWLATQQPDKRYWARVGSIKERFDRGRYLASGVRLKKDVTPLPDGEAKWNELFDDLSSYISTLESCALFLREANDPNAQYLAFPEGLRDPVRRRNAALQRSRIVAIYRPLLFACRLRHPEDGKLYADLLEVCERYSARVFVIEQRRSNAGEQSLYGLAKQLFDGEDPSWVLERMRAVLWRYAPDDSMRTTLEAVEEDWYHRQGHKYVLYEYELSMLPAGQELPDFGFFTQGENVARTTEHILPQGPRENAVCWWDHFTTEQHQTYLHSLGNLVLTLDNSSYSNKCFADQRGEAAVPGVVAKPCYAQGKLYQERELAHVKEWTPDAIRERQLRMTDWVMHRWSVPAPGSESLREDDQAHEVEDDAPDLGSD